MAQRGKMNWAEWKSYDLYKKLWSLIGNRPWTYIIRDAWHKVEFIWIVGLVSLGVWLGHSYDWKSILIGWGIFSLGFILGHAFWGKRWVENEQGE